MVNRVLVAHPNILFADALAAAIGKEADIEVVGVCFNGEQTVGEIERLRPDVLVVGSVDDVPLEGILTLSKNRPDGTAVLMIASENGTDDLVRAMEAGVA